MTVAVHLNPRDARLFKKHAARSGMSLSDFAILSMRERMEDELDRQAYEEAMKEFRANPVTPILSPTHMPKLGKCSA